MDSRFQQRVANREEHNRIIAVASAIIVVAAGIYGFTFGVWRSPLQGCYSAVKMPLLFFSVVVTAALINTMLAQAMGTNLSFKQVCVLVLTGMTVTAVVMAALAPVMLYFVLQAPGPDARVLGLSRLDPRAAGAMRTYTCVLLAHVGVVGFAGLLGNIHLYRLIRMLTGSAAQAIRVLLAWIGVMGFVGCELSWLLSPFLCEPVAAPHLIARLYWEYNFYEYVWYALTNGG